MSFRTMLAVGLAMLLLADSARAELTAFWRHNPITPQAIADDPALAGMQSWSVMVSITSPSGRWVYGGARLTLPDEFVFYRHPLGGPFRPSQSQQKSSPALTFHTYITQPQQLANGSRPPSILGGFPDAKAQFSFGGINDPIPGVFSLAWGDPFQFVHSPGIYEIARFTFPEDVLPGVHPESQTTQALPDQTVFIPTTIPEPIACGLAGTAALLLRRRVRRS